MANPAAVVAAILLPPFGVYLDRGITPAFWLTTLLTCLAFLPGMICAVILVLTKDGQPSEPFTAA